MKKYICYLYVLFCIFITNETYALSNGDILANSGIVTKQYTEKGYRLNDFVLRQEVISMAIKLKGQKLSEKYQCRGYYKDVSSSKPNNWGCRVIETAADVGLITKSNKYFRPEDKITISEVLAILIKASNLNNQTDNITLSIEGVAIEPWQKKNFEIGLLYGIIDFQFAFTPNKNATRGEIFEIAKRIISLTSEDNINNNAIGESSNESINSSGTIINNNDLINTKSNYTGIKKINSIPFDASGFSGTFIQKTAIGILSTYSPDEYKILKDYYSTPNKYIINNDGDYEKGIYGSVEYGEDTDGSKFTITIGKDNDYLQWIHGESEQEIINSLNTVVHEINHGYTDKLYLETLMENGAKLMKGEYYVFYLGNGEKKLVKLTPVFETKLMNSDFPEKLKQVRYKLYIYPSKPILGSQQHGAYGLLDELNSYYHGTKVAFDLYQYYKEHRNNEEGWGDYFQNFDATIYAYLEFKSYILEYMIYAKENYPDIYKGIIENKDYLYALKKVDENYDKLITDYNSLKRQIISEQKLNGLKIYDTDGFTYINNRGGYANFIDVYNQMNTELKKDRYKDITNALGLKRTYGPKLGE